MAETRSQRMLDALDAFLSTSPDVEAAAVVSFDGLSMASALPDDMEEDRVGAMSAALLSLGEQAAQGLGRGELRQLFVEADDGFVFLMSARDQAVLVAVAGQNAKIGLMLFEMRRAADEVGALLEGEPSPTEPAVNGSAGQGSGTEAAPSAPVAMVDVEEPATPAAPSLEAAERSAGMRDPFGDREPDEPHYVTTNGRERDGTEHGV